MTVVPRPASTIVLMDKRSRVYLTKRPSTMKFLAGYYVFPGGAVETGDDQFDCKYLKNAMRDNSVELAHYVAAARELFEEVGVLLCDNDAGRPVHFPRKIEMEYRRLLMKGEISFLEMVQKERLYLNLENINYFGHIITPKESPIRFDTRFFLSHLPEGQSPFPDFMEIADAMWITPQDALSSYLKGKLPIVRPTIQALKTIIDYQNGRPLVMPDLKRS